MNNKKPLLLDGAMGTELINRGLHLPLPIWSANANINHPEIVKDIHEEYIASGVDIITTNTFRTTTWTFRKTKLSLNDSREMARTSLYKAVDCAHQIKEGNIKIAGSITSIEDCYYPEKFPGCSIAYDIYGETLEWLVDSGVDIIFFETMGNVEEIACACSIGKDYKIPIWLSLIMRDEISILDGTNVYDVFDLLEKFSMDYVLTNCNKMELTVKTCNELQKKWNGKWGAYPNLGVNEYENDYFEIIDNPFFKKCIKSILEKSPNVIGLCCGSTPKHVKFLNKLINSV